MNTTTEELLEKTSIRKLALRWGIPAMFGQFFNPLYSIVEVWGKRVPLQAYAEASLPPEGSATQQYSI